MADLSVVMIVRDEAECLAACLESIQSIAREIVVGDTGSTDATREVAAQFGAQVWPVPWREDFAAARNTVLAEATNDWVLHMDADEVLDPAGTDQIRAILQADGNGADAIEVTLRNYGNDIRSWRWVAAEPNDPFARGYAGYLPVGLLRLFRNRCGFEYREPVHENITESVLERGGTIAAAPIVIHHYGFESTPEKMHAKRQRYYRMAREKAAQRPRDPKAWHDLAEQALAAGDTALAEEAARTTIAIDPNHLAALTTLGTILLNRGDVNGAHSVFAALDARGATAPHIATALAAIAYREGRLDEARARLERVAAGFPKDIHSRLYLARVCDAIGDSETARKCLAEALAIAPGLPELQDRARAHERREAARHTLAMASDTGQTAQAMRELVESLRIDPEDPVTYRALGAALERLGQPEQAKTQFDRADRLNKRA